MTYSERKRATSQEESCGPEQVWFVLRFDFQMFEGARVVVSSNNTQV